MVHFRCSVSCCFNVLCKHLVCSEYFDVTANSDNIYVTGISDHSCYYKEMQAYLAEAKENSPDFVGIHRILKRSRYSCKRVSLILDT